MFDVRKASLLCAALPVRLGSASFLPLHFKFKLGALRPPARPVHPQSLVVSVGLGT